jgi:ADP-heptose:LPS heptosyltransferase
VAALDLTISVDTSVAHLAGAIGAPVWLLNRRDTDWRWLHHGETTMWYPSMRIFRQKQMRQWDQVIADVRAALLAS